MTEPKISFRERPTVPSQRITPTLRIAVIDLGDQHLGLVFAPNNGAISFRAFGDSEAETRWTLQRYLLLHATPEGRV